MKIRSKIILLVAGLISFLAVSGIFTFYKFSEISRQLGDIASQNIVLSNKVVDLNLLHLDHTELFKRVVEKGLLLEANRIDKSQFDASKNDYSHACSAFDTGVHGQEKLVNDETKLQFLDTGERAKMRMNIDSVLALHQICAPRAGRVFTLLESGELDNALALADTFYYNEKLINNQLSGLLSSYNSYSASAIRQSGLNQKKIVYQMLLVLIIISLTGIAGAGLLAQGIIRSLNKAVWFAGEIEKGNRNVQFGNIPGDEVGGLLHTLKKMLKALRESEEVVLSEKKKSDDLLLNILPAEVADELKNKGSAEARHFDNVTVLFTDFKGFTTMAERLSPQQLVNELDACFRAFDHIMERHNIEKIKTVGDAYLAVCGLPHANPNHATTMVQAALEIIDFMNARKAQVGDMTFDIRVGLHTGNVVAGIVGVKKFAYDIWGDTVNTAARMEQNSDAGKINISQNVYDLVRHQFVCTYRGEIAAKNKGALGMYFVEGKK